MHHVQVQVAASCFALLSTATLAQTSPQPASSAGSTSSASPALQEVVVTANKISQPLLSVPTPVTALTAAELSRQEAVSFADYAADVPGLNLTSDRAGETQLIIRGITTGSYVSSTVATYIDESPYGTSTGFALGGQLTPDLDPGDLERIEVLRGPQGTLYGASALGGVLKFVTIAPDPHTFGGHFEVDGSSVDGGGNGYGVRGGVNVPLVSDSLALRVSAYDRNDPGYIDDPNLGRRNLNSTHVDGGRGSLLWKPSDSLSITLTAIGQDVDGQGTADEDVNVIGGSIVPSAGEFNQVRYTAEPLHVQYRQYSATVNDDFGFANLTSVSSYSTLHQFQIFDETPTFGALGTQLTGIPDFGTSTGSDLGTAKWTQEIRLASAAGAPLEWLGGFFFTHEQSTRNEPTYNFDTVTGATTLPPDTLFFASLVGTYREFAGFGDVTYHVTPQVDVLAGLRYSTNSQDFALGQSGLFAGGSSNNVGTSSDHSVTYLVTPSYKFDPDDMLYLRVASGYRPGGPNAPSPADLAAGVPAAYKPDKLTDYDLGYKAAMLDKALTVDVSAFYIDWRDIQIETDFNGITSTGNGGKAVSDGVEAEVTLTPVHGLTVAGNLTYTDARLTEDAPGVNGHDGDALPNVPHWAAGLDADEEFPIVSNFTGFVGAGVHYLDSRTSGFVTGSPATYVRPTMPAYTTVDARTGVSYGAATVELYVRNLGNARGINNLTSLDLSGYLNPFAASVIPPRTVGLSLKMSF